MTDSTNLDATIQKIRERIINVENRNQNIGEQNTKATLIDPVLSALGWDLEDLDDVSREYKLKPQDNPVDYALFLKKSPCLFIEAKSLEQNLSERKWVSQTLTYTTVVGVEWCVLTNGDEYKLYNAHAPVDVDAKLFRSVRISDIEQHDYVRTTLELLSKDQMEDKRLNVLWQSHFIDRRVKSVLDELFSGDDTGLIRLIRKKMPIGVAPSDIRDSLKRADIRIDFPLAQETTLSTEMDHAVPESTSTPKATGISPEPIENSRRITVNDLIKSGVISASLKLFKIYKGHRLTANIRPDGRIEFQGVEYDSLSVAAGMARKTIVGVPSGHKYPSTNGWTFWRLIDPETGDEFDIDVMRRRYINQQADA